MGVVGGDLRVKMILRILWWQVDARLDRRGTIGALLLILMLIFVL